MATPRRFRNRIIELFLALALFLILINFLTNIEKKGITGFFELNSQKNEKFENLSDINNFSEKEFNEEIIFEEIVLNNFTDVSFNQNFNQSKNLSSSIKKRGSRGSSNSNGPLQESFGNFSNNSENLYLNKKIKGIPKNLFLLRDGEIINEGEEIFVSTRFTLEKSNLKISEFNIESESDIDFSDIIADTDFESGKSFIHSTSGLLKDVFLYVPIKEGIDAIVVCSNASSYDEIYYGCSELPQITKEEFFYINDSSRVNISVDGKYFIIQINGTGAMGVNISFLNSTKANPSVPGNISAFAGNITEIIFPEGSGITQSWQGYFGNVSGEIILSDSSKNIMYNWTLASPEGIILASSNNSIVWENIQCFNFTASGNYTQEENGGKMNLFGTNLTQLEFMYNISQEDIDGVDETFSLIGLGTHNKFYVNYNEFEEGKCHNTRIFDSSGAGVDNHFEEVLLYEPTTYSVIFGAILNEDVFGFDKKQHDFEMIVLEDGHKDNKQTTTYYFYAVMY